jgi:hypothetical protein
LLGFADYEVHVPSVAGVPASEAVKLLSIRVVNIVVFGSDTTPLKFTPSSDDAPERDMGIYALDVLVSILPDAFVDWFHCFKVIVCICFMKNGIII